MNGLRAIQQLSQHWRARNFPNHTAEEQLLGVVEEVGELAHSHIKLTQKIRGTEAEHQEEMKDAVGDIVIFLMGYCSCMGIDLANVIQDTWDEVSQRDWITWPETGKPPT